MVQVNLILTMRKVRVRELMTRSVRMLQLGRF